MDKTTYLNHYYLVSLISFLMIFFPANASYSVDSFVKKKYYKSIPKWNVDSLKLIKEIDKRAAQNNRIIDCLLQIHIAEEETKFGLSDIEATQVLAYAKHLNNVRIKGLMGMATNTRDESIVRNEFAGLKELFLKFQSVSKHLQIISMGMSTDYEIAIEQGSTMVRVGSAIFGRRN